MVTWTSPLRTLELPEEPNLLQVRAALPKELDVLSVAIETDKITILYRNFEQECFTVAKSESP